MIIAIPVVPMIGGIMTDDENEPVAMAECGVCRAVIPLDSKECPECDATFSGVSDVALGECGACKALVPLDSTRCSECGVVFVADDVVEILRKWVNDTGINIRKLFDRFDENSDGMIDSGELKRGLLSLNLADLPPTQIDRLIQEIDRDENGLIDLDEFDKILKGEDDDVEDEVVEEAEESKEESSAKPMGFSDNVLNRVMKKHGIEDREAFIAHASSFDDDDNGYLNDRELTNAAQAWGESSDESEEESDDEVQETDEVEETEEVQETEEDHSDEDDASEVAEDTEVEIEAEMDEEDFDIDEEEMESEEVQEIVSPLHILANMMDEHDISAQRFFNDLDKDGNGSISRTELISVIQEKYSDMINIEDVEGLIEKMDIDGDGMIDIMEFTESMESLDDHDDTLDEDAKPKEFPSPMQRRMMSKSWNDTVWPLIHTAFGIMIVLLLVNALLGPVDGSGGMVEYVAKDPTTIVMTDDGTILEEGSIYECDITYQEGECANSLTPLSGESSSMPKGFYWDGIMLLMMSIIGIVSSLFIHLIKAPAWRARAKAMKEHNEDKADAEEASSEGEELDGEDGEGEDDVDEEHDDDSEGDAEDDDSEETDDDEIDIGSHVGLTFDDEEVFGTIIEFDDEEGTVTIKEDGSGDEVTGYQEDMFIE